MSSGATFKYYVEKESDKDISLFIIEGYKYKLCNQKFMQQPEIINNMHIYGEILQHITILKSKKKRLMHI